MAHHPPQPDAINRRALLLRGTASGLALAVGRASALEQPKTRTQLAAKAAAAVEPPNLHPPVVQVKGGKLRGLKDGKVFTFLWSLDILSGCGEDHLLVTTLRL